MIPCLVTQIVWIQGIITITLCSRAHTSKRRNKKENTGLPDCKCVREYSTCLNGIRQVNPHLLLNGHPQKGSVFCNMQTQKDLVKYPVFWS